MHIFGLFRNNSTPKSLKKTDMKEKKMQHDQGSGNATSRFSAGGAIGNMIDSFTDNPN